MGASAARVRAAPVHRRPPSRPRDPRRGPAPRDLHAPVERLLRHGDERRRESAQEVRAGGRGVDRRGPHGTGHAPARGVRIRRDGPRPRGVRVRGHRGVRSDGANRPSHGSRRELRFLPHDDPDDTPVDRVFGPADSLEGRRGHGPPHEHGRFRRPLPARGMVAPPADRDGSLVVHRHDGPVPRGTLRADDRLGCAVRWFPFDGPAYGAMAQLWPFLALQIVFYAIFIRRATVGRIWALLLLLSILQGLGVILMLWRFVGERTWAP